MSVKELSQDNGGLDGDHIAHGADYGEDCHVKQEEVKVSLALEAQQPDELIPVCA